MEIYEEQERVVITEEEEIDTLSETRARDIITEDSAIIAERTVILRDLSFNTSNVVYEENSAKFDGIFTYTDEKGTERTSEGAISLSLGNSDEVILYVDNQVLKAKLSDEIKAKIPTKFITTAEYESIQGYSGIKFERSNDVKQEVLFNNNDFIVWGGSEYTIIAGEEVKIRDYINIFLSGNVSKVNETAKDIELSMDDTTYILTAKLKDKNGVVLSTQTIDLPLEEMIISAEYDKTTKEIVLTLKSGQTTRISVADLVSGLVSTTEFNQAIQDLRNDIPTKTSELTNDSGFITIEDVPGAKLYNGVGQNTDGAMTQKATTDEFNRLNARINDLQYDTFPNAVRVGDLTINDGQVSGFTTADYLMFPFILDVQNRPFQVDFCFTTGNDVTTQQNVLDSKFGIALAIKNGKGLMAVSNNGINWASQGVGTINIQPNTTYYARLSWNRLVYKTQISTDGTNYVDDISITNATQPYPVTMFIGGGSVEALGHTATPFFGSIDMNKAYLYVDSRLVWHGMITASLETLADVSLSNIDSAGIQVIKDNGGTDVKVNNVKQTEINFTSDPQTQLNECVIHEDAGTTQEGVPFYTKTESDERYKAKLLWENQNIGSSFSPQTITTQNMSNYNFLLVEYRQYAGDTRRDYELAPNYINVQNNMSSTFVGASSLLIRNRSYTIKSATTIEFEQGYAYDGNYSTSPSHIVPTRIFGLNI